MEEKLSTFRAIAEPNRLHIVELLRNGPLTVGEISEKLELRQPQTFQVSPGTKLCWAR